MASQDIAVYRKVLHMSRYHRLQLHYPTHMKDDPVKCLHNRIRGQSAHRATFRVK